MNKLSPLIVALTIAALFAGCGGGSGLQFSDLFDDSARAEGTGVQGFALVRAVVVLATHDATARQRQVAAQNGRRAVAKLQARIAAEEKAPAPSPKRKVRRKTPAASAAKAKDAPAPKTAAAKSKPKPAAEPEEEPAPKPKPRKKLPRIIAVATEKNESTNPKAAKAVMLFDTHSQEIIGNKVYDIEREPQAGEEVRFETYSTSYVGASL